eukprot:SAG11_NODE_10642_length_814_cov_5.356643_1_plen_28_part_01
MCVLVPAVILGPTGSIRILDLLNKIVYC